jgi:single-strand DNA-binding protein
MNKFICTGRWSKEIGLKYLTDGKAVANTSIAIPDRFNKDKTTFLPVVIYGKSAEHVANHTDKGMKVAIEGRIETRSWDGQDGKKIYVTELIAENVEFLEFKQKASQDNNASQNANRGQRGTFNDDPFANDGTPIDISDDDLPF